MQAVSLALKTHLAKGPEALTQIAATDEALVRLLDSCGFPGVTVMSAPHEWDAGFVQGLLAEVPAILVAFIGGEPFDDTKTSTVLEMQGKWSILIASGWNGRDQKARRLGAGAGFDLMHRAASRAAHRDPDGRQRRALAASASRRDRRRNR